MATEPLDSAQSLLARDARTGELRQRRYEITVVVGPETGRSSQVDRAIVVGSDPDADFPLTDSAVSRAHLQLIPRADGLFAQDLHSTNGTFLGNARIEELTAEGDCELRVGRTVLRVRTLDLALPAPAELQSFGGIESRNPVMRRVLGMLELAARSTSPLLLQGESGVGKGFLARAVHERSPRAGRPFVVLDCAALSAELVESEIFGHVKGAFTGAYADRDGVFVAASGGTLFLDELGELPLEVQPKLLRVLDTRAVQPLGRGTTTRVDVRLIAATNRALEEEVAAGRFRRDLYFRLAVLTVPVPPLRERLEDLPVIVERLVQASGRIGAPFSQELLERFSRHPFPGNIRELRNVLDAALAGLEFAPLPGGSPARRVVAADPSQPYKEAKDALVAEFTDAYLSALMEACGGNISEMARRAGVARHYLRAMLERHGLRPSSL